MLKNNSDYRGHQDKTVGGLTCQKWTSQTPHKHTRTPDKYPNAGLGDNNYCRNPDGEKDIWCYTTDKNKRWDYCKPEEITSVTLKKSSILEDISKLQLIEKELYEQLKDNTYDEKITKKGLDYRGHQNKTTGGLTCQKWTSQTPHIHTNTPDKYPNAGLGDNNYCRNPDDAKTIWCYTTDKDKRWDYCNPISQKSEKTKILNRINELSQIRINLYQQLQETIQNKSTIKNKNINILGDKHIIVNNTERKMNKIKKQLNKRKETLNTKIRIIEINDDLLKNQTNDKNVVKIIFITVAVIVLAMLLTRLPFFPSALSQLIVVIALVVCIGYVLSIKYYEFSERNLENENFYRTTGGDNNNLNNDIIFHNNKNKHINNVNKVNEIVNHQYAGLTKGAFSSDASVRFVSDNVKPNSRKHLENFANA